VSGGLAARLGRGAVAAVLRDEPFAQQMKITTQHAQLQVSAEAAFGAVAASPQAVARLEGGDRRLDARVTLACLAEFDACGFGLLGGLVTSGHGQTGVLDDLGQPTLVLGRVKAPVEGRPANASSQTLLHAACLVDDHVAVVGVAGEEVGMGDEPRPVLVDEQLTPELHRLGRLAPLVKLRVRLEDAEELLGVGDLLPLQHASPGGAAHLPRSLEEHGQFDVQSEDFGIDRGALGSRIVSARASSSR